MCCWLKSFAVLIQACVYASSCQRQWLGGSIGRNDPRRALAVHGIPVQQSQKIVEHGPKRTLSVSYIGVEWQYFAKFWCAMAIMVWITALSLAGVPMAPYGVDILKATIKLDSGRHYTDPRQKRCFAQKKCLWIHQDDFIQCWVLGLYAAAFPRGSDSPYTAKHFVKRWFPSMATQCCTIHIETCLPNDFWQLIFLLEL